ncbi:MAG: ferrous iron transport protein B [Flavobacteriales bacterium]|nr:MAG: ferrous iron transport protein B [Flavobacteriales bacterium]
MEEAAVITPSKTKLKIALAGNPNSGKSTFFNNLTGLNQKVGNYPGVTVDKKTGTCFFENGSGKITAEIIDLPGAYSVKSKSEDERIAAEVISNHKNKDHPDVIVYVADASNLKRALFYCTQLIDLGKPVVLVLNMIDIAQEKGIKIDFEKLSEELGTPVVSTNARKNIGTEKVLSAIGSIDPAKNIFLNGTENGNAIYLRYKKIDEILQKCVSKSPIEKPDFTKKLDAVFTHKIWGFAIFLGVLLLIFQAIFSLSEYPMQWIESSFILLNDFISNQLPEGALTDLLTNGILAGLSGVLVFIPQIALLFFFIAILEDTGYMARVSFITDKIMRKFGLNGRSVVPLISGVACAVPAIMSARTIGNRKERLITIMITPLMTCSARLPVYILLISLVIPNQKFLGFFTLQGIVLMGMYLLGFVAVFGAAFVFKFVLKSKERSYFIMEMPTYKMPRWKNIGLTILEKIKVFTYDVGKVIIAISIVLWALASYGPGDSFEQIEKKYNNPEVAYSHSPEILANKMASEKLEASYAGVFGKAIEPIIKPLGFDWKIGIALITSFAAREVFVGTMATIYSIGDADDTLSIRQKMMAEINPETGGKVYSLAVGLSLMVFYAFAMQCMSTLAVVFRETKHWKWPLIQLVYMTALAYLSSLLAFQFLK